jgi:hypothetical protein
MPLGCIRYDADEFPPIAMTCPRCGSEMAARFPGPCPSCVGELREKFRPVARDVGGAEYEPAMHVTPNAVALKDD